MDLITKNCVGFWNCAGGIKSKFDYIKSFLLQNKLSIFFISESELDLNTLDIVKIKDYDLLISNTLPAGKSRLSCYIHSSIRYKQLYIRDKLDIIALDIGAFRVIGLYKGFKLPKNGSRVSFFDSIIKTLTHLAKTDRKLLIGGDFNVDLLKHSSERIELENWSINFGVTQLVSDFTRRRSTFRNNNWHTEQSLIDHVYTNDSHINEIHMNSVSDHDILLVTKVFPLPRKDKLIVRDWRKYSKDKVQQEILNQMAQISTSELTISTISNILTSTLNLLAPKRVIRVKEDQLISPKLEALKKKRDRLFKKFKKFGNPKHLAKSDELSKSIKKTIKKEANRIFQCKAKSPDPKHFWQAVNQSLGRFTTPLNEIEIDGVPVTDSELMSNFFSNFFLDKVQQLSSEPTAKIILDKPKHPIKFSLMELEQVMKRIPSKRSYGVDGIPQSLIRDGYTCFTIPLLGMINDFASNGLPPELKEARVLPLLKKGDKRDIKNYRPISNVTSFSKIYEKCLLNKLESEFSGLEGDHQHGFRKNHSTETALLTIQSEISGILNSKRSGIIYSVDLSAAFDLLMPDKFYHLFKDQISNELMFCIMDFLQDRCFHVEVGGKKSRRVSLDRGCVQGSVLGPRLFSVYTGGLLKALSNTDQDSCVKIVTYADDTYVIISSDTDQKAIEKCQQTAIKHFKFLENIGMKVNKSKTEIMWIGKGQPIDDIQLGGTVCPLVNSLKSLGIHIQGDLSWDTQAENAIAKGKNLCPCSDL